MMRSRLRTRLSPALAVSLVALFVSLGGTAWAVTALTKNSVRSTHIGNGQVKTADLGRSAVTSAKVKNRSLRRADFAAGQLPQGPAGPKGDTGAPGPTEGTSTDALVAAGPISDITVDSSSIATTRAGRAWVSKALSSLEVDCLGTATWQAWLSADGIRVPGNIITALPDNTLHRGLSFSGVTAGVLPAGNHTLAVEVDCAGTTPVSTIVGGVGNGTVVVLG